MAVELSVLVLNEGNIAKRLETTARTHIIYDCRSLSPTAEYAVQGIWFNFFTW